MQHTSASLMINENADPDVQKDMEMGLNKIVPESLPYVHTAEGPDDMVINNTRRNTVPSSGLLINSVFSLAI